MTFFNLGLILALTICAVGLVFRFVQWGCVKRVFEDAKCLEQPPIPLNWLGVIGKGVQDILMLSRTLRGSGVRWLAHCLVFFGFMGLLFFHALDDLVTARFFPAYESPLDPWQLLRNLFGLITLVGLGLMILRRVIFPRLRSLSRTQDWTLLFVVGGIILSGFLLETSKVISPAVFDRMTNEYFIAEEGSDLTALKAFWSKENGVVFSIPLPLGDDMVSKGAQLSEENCSTCHSPTESAFVSRYMASVLGPLAQALNRSRADQVFWYCHIIFCFVGLAALPFGKFLHPLSVPINLLFRHGRRDGNTETNFIAQGVGMDACTRCGICSLHCSVAPIFTVLGTPDILPSEKLVSLKRFVQGKRFSWQEMNHFSEGSRICTECLRCTDICPSGINLQNLWLASKPLVSEQFPDSNRAIRQMRSEERIAVYADSSAPSSLSGLADNAESFWDCVQCTTCTSVCPVVAVSEDPSRDLDMTPQQIMNLLRMGLKDQALGVRMVWSCTTCYKCQEHCPQNIKVADVLYELRNIVAARKRERS
ncbi:4Fe-4S dicluster domain-containing protein [Pseudodesulfovibrio piezophilus]|uniref:Heterodisulfide reductase subunit C-like protein n=1 Tax=Pseudodesulfovibrio piezophilus (strain DSM 21447 / JCM 15486 / C1TLV30) TaxID=1322246 RepID=M1WJH2_PSEP2|nr:4Fe-4S dicluster domain-containing protein [Pseudodesulfovibrio piezophilus]CCH47891.1 Heterodisulfide reductase subunit C-like protein [Pseudodesulfovibrio piezophilus C1TLV30]